MEKVYDGAGRVCGYRMTDAEQLYERVDLGSILDGQHVSAIDYDPVSCHTTFRVRTPDPNGYGMLDLPGPGPEKRSVQAIVVCGFCGTPQQWPFERELKQCGACGGGLPVPPEATLREWERLRNPPKPGWEEPYYSQGGWEPSRPYFVAGGMNNACDALAKLGASFRGLSEVADRSTEAVKDYDAGHYLSVTDWEGGVETWKLGGIEGGEVRVEPVKETLFTRMMRRLAQ